jgi:hypothetical protein
MRRGSVAIQCVDYNKGTSKAEVNEKENISTGNIAVPVTNMGTTPLSTVFGSLNGCSIGSLVVNVGGPQKNDIGQS